MNKRTLIGLAASALYFAGAILAWRTPLLASALCAWQAGVFLQESVRER